jgi:hypothetical protein
MNPESKILRLLLHSPWFLLLFCIIPALVIISFSAHVHMPLAGYKPLLVNNVCFALVVAIRFLYGLKRLSASFRYPPDYGQPQKAEEMVFSPVDARSALTADGFRFDERGEYAEKRDMGAVGTLLIYGGILLLLGTGVWDSLRQFSGTLQDGVGMPTKLNDVEIYRILKKGPLTPQPKQLPRIQVTRQLLPNATYPLGATEVLLLPEKGEPQMKTLIPGERFAYRDYDIYMLRLLYEPYLVVRTKDSQMVFNGPVKLNPLERKDGPYGFSGSVNVDKMQVEVLYNPEQSDLRVIIHNRGKLILSTSMRFQVDKQIVQGGLVLSCEKMGQWSEIQVVRKRHTSLMALWGILVAAGLMMRLVIRPQRVWLVEDEAGCKVWAVGKDAKRRLKVGV